MGKTGGGRAGGGRIVGNPQLSVLKRRSVALLGYTSSRHTPIPLARLQNHHHSRGPSTVTNTRAPPRRCRPNWRNFTSSRVFLKLNVFIIYFRGRTRLRNYDILVEYSPCRRPQLLSLCALFGSWPPPFLRLRRLRGGDVSAN